jgi:hypothetical protein
MSNRPILPYPHSGAATSRAAAKAVRPGFAARSRRLILDAVEASMPDGLTREELEDRLRLAGNTVRPRVWELLASGALVESGRTRPTRSGRDAAVLIVPEGLI